MIREKSECEVRVLSLNTSQSESACVSLLGLSILVCPETVPYGLEEDTPALHSRGFVSKCKFRTFHIRNIPGCIGMWLTLLLLLAGGHVMELSNLIKMLNRNEGFALSPTRSM